MFTWKNISSYSQSDKVRTPNAFEAKCGQFRLVVHHYHGCGDTWFASCYTGILDQRQLKATDIEEAKLEAINLVKKILTDALVDLNG